MADGNFQLSSPPKVDFNRPFNEYEYLATRRQRLKGAIRDIQNAQIGLQDIDAEGVRNAQIATIWAGTMLVCNILKTGLSAGNRAAKLMFEAQDEGFKRADKILKILGMPRRTTREDILKSVDENLQGTSKAMAFLRDARNKLAKVGVKETKHVKLVLDLGITMTEDTLLMMNSMQMEHTVHQHTRSAFMNMQSHVIRLERQIMAIDRRITQIFEQYEVRSRTA